MDLQAQSYILLDVGIALILGGILGVEREWKKKPAGLKTNMIIAGSAALLVSLGRVVISDFSQIIDTNGG
jgi:putative Mg2+ transporter-C (MgtC) family protein